jgi:hypothetical protein
MMVALISSWNPFSLKRMKQLSDVRARASVYHLPLSEPPRLE